MTIIFLDDALRLVEQKRDRIQKLVQERKNSAVIKFEDGDDETFKNRPERSVTDLTSEIDFLQKQVRQIQKQITLANIETITDFQLDGEHLTLRELLIAIEQFRRELPEAESLSKHKNKKERVRRREIMALKPEQMTTVEITQVLYDVNTFRKRAEQLEKSINAAQREINKHGINIELDFVDEEYVSTESKDE